MSTGWTAWVDVEGGRCPVTASGAAARSGNDHQCNRNYRKASAAHPIHMTYVALIGFPCRPRTQKCRRSGEVNEHWGVCVHSPG